LVFHGYLDLIPLAMRLSLKENFKSQIEYALLSLHHVNLEYFDFLQIEFDVWQSIMARNFFFTFRGILLFFISFQLLV